MRGKKLNIITLFIFLLGISFSQENTALKQLLKQLKTHKSEDTLKANILNDVAWEYSYFNPDTSVLFCHKAIALSRKLQYQNGEASALNTLGINYRSLILYDSSFYYFNKALNIRKAQKRQDKVIAVMLNIANIYNQQKDFSNCILKYKEIIALAHEGGYKEAELVASTNLADVYRDMGSYDKGMETLNRALALNKMINDTIQAPYLYAALAQLQHEMGNSPLAVSSANKALKLLHGRKDLYLMISVTSNLGSFFQKMNQPDSALSVYLRATDFMNEVHDSIGLCIVSGNIAKLYLTQGDVATALIFAIKGTYIGKNIKDTTLYSNNILIAASVYTKKGDYKTALIYANEALPMIERLNNKKLLSSAYACLADIYKGLNMHDKRADYLEKSFACRDSAITEENNKISARLNVEFDVFGKEKEIELLNKSAELKEVELDKQKEARKFITGIAILFGTIVLVIIYFYFKIRKSNIIINKQKERVEAQNEIISSQKHLVEEKQKEIIDSINYAKRIQSAVLTGDDVWNKVSKEHFILFKPKDIVSGDFYWAYNTPNNRSVFALADCTGHGVPGGFMSMLGNSFLNEIVIENKIFSAAVILNKLREKIISALEQKGEEKRKDGMDIALCVWNKLNNTLEFAGANNALMLIRGNSITEIKGDKMPIGSYIGDDKLFSAQIVQLQPGDCLYMTTDGLPDQFGGEKGKKFKYRQLEELLVSITQHTMKEQGLIVEQKFENWKGSLEQIDDVSLVGIRV
ncbi:MAG: SpoIIE family protein phosphatase [Bacteroidia bacterium]